MIFSYMKSAAVLAFLLALLSGCGEREGKLVEEWETMGTWVRVEIHHSDTATANAGIAAVRAAFDSVNVVMNTWSPESEISRLNAAPAGSTFTLSPWLDECLSAAEDVRDASGGAFDPTAGPLMHLWGFYRREGNLPSRADVDSARALMGGYRHDRESGIVVKERDGTHFDLGGIAKGFAVDRAAEGLKKLGIQNALIDLGGNLYCLGAPPGREHWRVGIRNPLDRDILFAAIETDERAFATSGSYERFVEIDGKRYGHIMNPATGHPAEGFLSVTVLSPGATLGDALSTALFVLGPGEASEKLVKSYTGVEAVFILPPEEKNGKPCVLVPRAIRKSFSLLPGNENSFVVFYY